VRRATGAQVAQRLLLARDAERLVREAEDKGIRTQP
jgi:hypothetical protein